MGKKNHEGLRTVLRKSFRFITISMLLTCLVVWLSPEAIAQLFGATDAAMIDGCRSALRIFAVSFIPFSYIYVLMIVYKLYSHHHMALFISLALSLTVIPVLWLTSRYLPDYLWYSYLAAYLLEAIAIFALHKGTHVKFELK